MPARRRAARRVAFGLCLAAIFACLAASAYAPAHAADGAPDSAEDGPERLSFSERISLPYGGRVQRETAALTVRMLARLAVLRRAEPALADFTVVRFGLNDARLLTALADMALFPVVVMLEEDAEGAGLATAQAEVLAPASELAEEIQAALSRPGDLELRAEALVQAAQLAETTEELILLTIGQATGQGSRGRREADAVTGRLAYLSARLSAMEHYLLLLRRFGAAWTPPEDAETALRDLRRRDPDNALINVGLAEALLRLDRPQEAVRFTGEALALDPGLARAFYVRGMAQLRLRLSALAVADFDRALALRPDKAGWWRARGAAHLLRHDFDLMCSDLYRACTLGDCEGLAEVRAQNLCPGP